MLKLKNKIQFCRFKNIIFLTFWVLVGSQLFFAGQIQASTNWSMLADGAWCWFQDPRAVSYNNKTYVGAVSTDGNIVILQYDNRTGASTFSILHEYLNADDHAAPSILIRPDGRIMVFYSAHLGSEMYYRISTNPENISSWGTETKVNVENTPGAGGHTYPSPIQLSGESNKLYLFWRGGNIQPNFSTSTDGGTTWSAVKTLVNVPDQRPYIKYASDNVDEIHFAFGDGHPDNLTSNNLYYAYYKNGNFYKANGTSIGNMSSLPLSPSSADLVYDDSDNKTRSWVWDIALNGSGRPVIVYATFPSPTNHRYWYAVWNGSSWINSEITAAGSFLYVGQEEYSGGITLDHENPNVVYLSRQINGQYEIEKWITNNSGVTWSSESITANSERKNIRPVVPRGHNSSGPQVIWEYGVYNSFSEYYMSLMTNLDKFAPKAPSGLSVR
ncbi:MAG TPA: BNR-4 repeat-containing protein [Candidatus Moranbacteria bacterium]|nr:BNR-4 repeat-containing protein [Candidatus Moranbacteria bacterium]